MNFKKFLILLFVISSFVVTPVFATTPDVELADNSTSPDSFLYGVDIAIEEIDYQICGVYAFMLGKSFEELRCEKAIANADERCAELYQMMEQNKTEYVDKLVQDYQQWTNRYRNQVNSINDNATLTRLETYAQERFMDCEEAISYQLQNCDITQIQTKLTEMINEASQQGNSSQTKINQINSEV